MPRLTQPASSGLLTPPPTPPRRGRRQRRARPPPPARPTSLPFSMESFRTICSFWDFKNEMSQPTLSYDRAEPLLYDTTTGTWDSETSRKVALRSAMFTHTLRLIRTLGFRGCRCSAHSVFRFDAQYDPNEEVPKLPEWLPEGLVGLQEWKPLTYRTDFGEGEILTIG